MSTKKILITSGIVILVVVLAALGGGYWMYQNSPQKTYLELSQAIKNQDDEALAKLIDCDSLKQNVFDGEIADDINCDEFSASNPLGGEDVTTEDAAQFDESTLANNIYEAYTNNYLIQRGDTYEVEVATLSENEDDPELDVTFIISEVDGSWKITDIDFGFLEEFITAFADIAEDISSVDEEFEASLGEDVSVNNTTYEVIEVNTTDTVEAENFGDDTETIQAMEGKTFVTALVKNDFTAIEDPTGFRSTPIYKLVNDSDSSDAIDSLDFGSEEYENLFRVFDNVPQEYLDIEAANQVEVEDGEFAYTIDGIDYKYVLFEVDSGFNLSDYTLVGERTFAAEEESTFRFTIDL
jgi:hypothetical protein